MVEEKETPEESCPKHVIDEKKVEEAIERIAARFGYPRSNAVHLLAFSHSTTLRPIHGRIEHDAIQPCRICAQS